jgi:hypothetical protein
MKTLWLIRNKYKFVIIAKKKMLNYVSYLSMRVTSLRLTKYFTEAYQGLQLVRCFVPSRLIFIHIDKMFLHFSIKCTDKDEKLLGIATDFFSICLKLLSLRQKKTVETSWFHDFAEIFSKTQRRFSHWQIAHVIQQSFFAMTKNFYVLRINHNLLMECFTYYVLIITSSWNVFGQNEKRQVDMTWNV